MKIIKILALLGGLFLIGNAEAHYDSHYRDYRDGSGFHGHRGGARINTEQWRQRQRIEGGLTRGQLTPYEYAQLARQQRHIERVERRFKQDGRLDWRERQILKEKLTRASEDIRYFKHNDRYYGGNRFYR
ncbi:hypothetical protein [Candidatus Methylomicrobium oryzae]|jgi:hypothetical protein|uniref:hypothetical protein n=1 Tax=Candidatus Methylomicrobium oryzae TaxID=2802053 RepID=UPI0019239A24|nr:hypothetical protein [Methylomicrobium sp. RS1]MBL1263041.1 hypothetical protein [Methylomicrobium sp. RS1]